MRNKGERLTEMHSVHSCDIHAQRLHDESCHRVAHVPVDDLHPIIMSVIRDILIITLVSTTSGVTYMASDSKDSDIRAVAFGISILRHSSEHCS